MFFSTVEYMAAVDVRWVEFLPSRMFYWIRKCTRPATGEKKPSLLPVINNQSWMKQRSSAEPQLRLHNTIVKTIPPSKGTDFLLALYEEKLSRSKSQMGFFSVDMINSMFRHLGSSFLIPDICRNKRAFSLEFAGRNLPKVQRNVHDEMLLQI